MSIDPAPVLTDAARKIATKAATHPADQIAHAATQATMPPTTAGAESLGGEFVQCGLILVAGITLFWATYGRKNLAWSPPRLARSPGERRPALGILWIGGALMVWQFLATPIALLLTTRNSATTRSIGADGTSVLFTTATYLVGLGLVTLLHVVLRHLGSGRALGLTPLSKMLAPGKAIVAAIVAWALTYVVAVISVVVWQWLHYDHEQAHAMLQLMQRNESSPWVLWVTIANAALLAPIYEETLFRGHLQTALAALLPRSRWPAIVITSVLFAGMHDVWTMPAMFVFSLVVGAAYEWTGSLWVAIAIHVVFNGASTATFLAGR